jgi:hypothetical protein
MAAINVYTLGLEKIPYHTLVLTGQQWLVELLVSLNLHCFREQLEMQCHVFLSLVSQLADHADLRDSHTVSVHEQISIFLFIAINNTSSQTAAEQFQHSTEIFPTI